MPDAIAQAAPAAAPVPANPEAQAPSSAIEAPKPAAASQAAPPVAPETAKGPSQEEKVARAYAAMSKREIALVNERKRLAAEKAEVVSIRKEAADLKAAKEAAKRNPMAYLEAAGLSYDDLTNFITSGNQLTPELKTKAEIDEARAEARKAAEGLEAYKKFQAEEQTKAAAARKQAAEQEFERRHRRFIGSTIAFVAANAVQYELTNLHGAQAEVPKLIEAVYARSKKLLTREQAAEQIENYFVEQTEKALNSKKWQSLQAAKAAPPAKKNGASPPPAEAPQRQTLSNDLTAPASRTASPKKETQEERMARVKDAFNKAKAR